MGKKIKGAKDLNASGGRPAGASELTPRAREVLRKMRAGNEELIYSRGSGYVGIERVSRQTLFVLLRAMAISMDQFSEVGGVERYSINETGERLLTEAS